MSLMPIILGDSAGMGADTAVLPAFTSSTFTNTASTLPQVYAGIRFGSDGNIYRQQANGNYSVVGQWLVNGTAADYYISRSISSGSLDTDAGAGPLQLNANRTYLVAARSSPGQNRAVVTFDISDDSGGTPIVAGPRSYTIQATYETP